MGVEILPINKSVVIAVAGAVGTPMRLIERQKLRQSNTTRQLPASCLGTIGTILYNIGCGGDVYLLSSSTLIFNLSSAFFLF